MVTKIQQRSRLSNGVEHDRALVFQAEQVEDLVEDRTTPPGNVAFTNNSMGVRGDTLPQVPEMLYSDGSHIRAMSDGYPAVPTFLFDFAKDQQLNEGMVFTRSRPQTYWDMNGILRTAAVNEPAFTHDPVTGRSLGLIMEPTATNEVLWAEDLTNAVWSGGTITANYTLAPNDEQTADRAVQTGGEGTDFARQTVSSTNVSTSRMFSVFLKLTGQNEGDGTAKLVCGGSSVEVTVTGQWLRYDIKHDFGVAPTSYDLAVVTTLNGPTELLVWGAQAEAILRTSYIRTEAATVNRSAAVLLMNDYIDDVNLSEGTFFTQLSVNTVGGSNTPIFFLNNGTQQNRIMTFIISTGDIQGLTSTTTSPGNAGGSSATATQVADEVLGFSFNYASNNAQVFLNGDAAAQDTQVTMPIVGPFTIFRMSGFGGTMAKIAYYNEVLQADRAEALSEKPGTQPVTTKTGVF